jgi:CubicO group peptidase (beta-lactamase class C family)
MSKHANPFLTRPALAVIALGGLLALMVAIPVYLSAATPLHPEPQQVVSVVEQQPPVQWVNAIDRARQIVRAGVVAQNLPGLSVAVGIGGDVVWAEGFGWKDVTQRAAVTPHTRFRIGTASSMLTSAAVGVLLERGQLTLDEPIETHVPDVPATHWPVTLRQVMAHTAGLGTDGGNDGPLFRQRCERPVDALQYVANAPLLFEPGTQYRDSKYGWIVVSAAVEAAAGQPFLTFMRQQIFQPLGMEETDAQSTTEENPEHVGEPGEDAPPITLVRHLILEPLGIVQPEPPPPGAARLATFYAPRSGSDPRGGVRVMRPHNLSCYAGAMAFLSTPSDLVRFGLAIDSGTLLQPSTVRLLQTPQRLTGGQETGYGLGWDLETVNLAGSPAAVVARDGESYGGRVMSFMSIRGRGIVVAVMSNVSHADTSALARRVADAFAQQAR